MVRSRDILGMNARQALFVSLNSRSSRVFAYSKLEAKRVLKEAGIAVPEFYAEFQEMEQVRQFDWESTTTSFVIKPVGGNAGKGILVVRKMKNIVGSWLDIDGNRLDKNDLELHINDILEGQYSTYGSEHKAFVEERVMIHPKFKRYVNKGTPDVRVVVFNRVPVMAMLRLPTEESEGRANLHQGAIGVGIDIGTGITTYAISHDTPLRYVPGTKRKLNGVRIPKWSSTLNMAVEAAEVTGLRYAGVDLFVHTEKGPMVVELNGNPGLSIQLANKAGLRRRLERVEGLKVRNAEHGVRVGKALFVETFADQVRADEGLVIVDNFTPVEIKNSEGKWREVQAILDTGLMRSVIDIGLAEDLGLAERENVLWHGDYRMEGGLERRPIVEVKLRIKNRILKTYASLVDSDNSDYKIKVGRQDMEGFLVNPQPRPEV